MYVVSKRNIILPGPNGERFRMERDYMGPVPEWAEGSEYLNALSADGKVILSGSGSDRDFSAGGRKPRKPAEEPEGEREPSSGEQGEEP